MALALHLLLPLLSEAAAGGPCDIYGAAGTPCVAAGVVVPAVAAWRTAPVPQPGTWEEGTSDFQSGYLEGYQQMARERLWCNHRNTFPNFLVHNAELILLLLCVCTLSAGACSQAKRW